jgi:hypothetical protein
MTFWSLCAFIWFTNIEKMLLQMRSGFLQLESTLDMYLFLDFLINNNTYYCGFQLPENNKEY